MSDISKGYSFSGSSPNNSVTAEKLNTLVDGARILPGFYTDKTEVASLADGDYLLVYSAAAGAYRKVLKSNSITAPVNQTGFRNLVAVNNATTPATKIDVTADEIVLRSDTGDSFHASGIIETLDIGTYSGASTINGRDFTPLTGAALFGGIWAVSNGGLTKLLFSQANTPGGAPVLPTGYIYKALLGVVYMTSGGTLIRFSQRGNDVSIAVASLAGTAAATLNPFIGGSEFTDLTLNAVSGTWTAVSLAFCIPTLASRVRGTIGSTVSTTALAGLNGYGIATLATGTMQLPTLAIGAMFTGVTNAATAAAFGGFKLAAPFEVGVGATRTIYAAVNNTAANHNMRISGYTLNL